MASLGLSLFARGAKKPDEAQSPSADPAKPAQAPADGKERLTANEWAKRHGVNEVLAERAAMRAGRWHDAFTEEEFLEMLKRADA